MLIFCPMGYPERVGQRQPSETLRTRVLLCAPACSKTSNNEFSETGNYGLDSHLSIVSAGRGKERAEVESEMFKVPCSCFLWLYSVYPQFVELLQYVAVLSSSPKVRPLLLLLTVTQESLRCWRNTNSLKFHYFSNTGLFILNTAYITDLS